MQQIDFTITLKSEKSLSFQYNDHHGVRKRDGKLIPDPIARFTVKRMNDWINLGLLIKEINDRDALDPADLKAIGLNLYRILFGDPEVEMRFRDLYDDFATDRMAQRYPADSRMGLRLVFNKSAALLGELPWEFLFIPDRNTGEDAGTEEAGKGNFMSGFFFGEREELVLTRNSPADDADQQFEIGDQPLRILLAVYTGFPRMNVIRTEEIEMVKNQMSRIPGAKIESERNLSSKTLRSLLKSYKPHIFHFIGHGDAGRLSVCKSDEEEDYDQKRAGDELQVRWLEAPDFRSMFEYPGGPRLVFLQACNGSATPTNSLGCAQELIRARIPAVIAMQHSIRAFDAATFAVAFYEKLGKGTDIDEAVRSGRQKLGRLQSPNWNHPRFGTPVVYLRTEDKLVNLKNLADKNEPIRTEPVLSAMHTPGAVSTAPAIITTTPATGRPSENTSRFERTS